MHSPLYDIPGLMRRHGSVMAGKALQQGLGVSQPTLSRLLAPLLQSGTVVAVGAARARRYLLPRTVAGVGSDIPIARIDVAGRPSPFGRMVPLDGGGIWIDEADGLHRRHDGLPWFLDDMRPQGFMGRTFAHAHPELQLGMDPRHWSDDDVLRALALYGDDLPGNLVVGAAAFDRFHTLPVRATPTASADDYPALAERALQGTLPGSSAGGEQPKFCTVTAGRPVLVKFSPAGGSAADQRMRDLLVCEHLALQTLADAGIAAARTAVSTGGGRVFLEAERFDRTATGRIGMVSLLVYDAEYIGQMDHWAATADRLAARGLLRPADAARLRLLEAYGRLIGNTDRHYGNVSLLLEGDDWVLAPVYDMLPMLYAPIAGEVVARDFAQQGLASTAAVLAEWPHAQALARRFWERAAQDGRISTAFRTTAAQNRSLLGDA